MTALGNIQFYGLMLHLENYHRLYYNTIVLQQEVIEKFGAIIFCHWDKPRIVFNDFAEKLVMVFEYNKTFITSDFANENLLDTDSYFNVSLHFKLPPQEHLIRFSKSMDVGFGIMLPWNK